MIVGWIWFVFACIWAPNLSFINGDTDQADASALNVLYGSLNSPPQLTGWTANGGDPCGQSWRGIICSGSSVTEIKLSGLGFSGTLGYKMNIMTSLVELDLSNNNLNGSQIPYNLPQNLERLDLSGNQYGGNPPYSISTMISLEYLNLARNHLEGNLNDMFGQLTNLTTMDLSFNNLSGGLPQSFSSLSSLTNLNLQNNHFSGQIDVLANLPLEDLNVANNNFSGWIPDKLKNINNIQIGGNQWSSGPAPPPPPFTPPPPGRRINPGGGPGGNSNSGPSSSPSSGKSSGIGAGGIAGIIISILVISAIIAFFLVKKKKRKSPQPEVQEQDEPFTSLASNEHKEVKSFQTSSMISTNTVPTATPISLKPPPRHNSFDEDDFLSKPVIKKVNTVPIKATVYSIADLQMATASFSIDNLVGEGSLGRVYRAQFSDGKVLAVKKINSSALPNPSTEYFMELVSNISCLHHANLTELVGYCSEHGQHLLVYEFHKNGSLHDLLHISDEYSKPLSWNTRVKIALGTARALEYLHEVCSPSIVHKNFKSANILLDTELNPHLSDSGLATLIPNPEYQALDSMASGYNAPEVAMSGQYTMKSDVYSFGVVMLELMTGRKPFDGSRLRAEQLLVRWATPQLHDIDALDKMVDPALQGLYPAKSLSRFADVIALCIQPEPEFRPPMSEVVQALVRLVQRANMSKRLLSGEGLGTPRRGDDPDMQDYM